MQWTVTPDDADIIYATLHPNEWKKWAIAGGLILITLIVLLLVWWRRGSKKKAAKP